MNSITVLISLLLKIVNSIIFYPMYKKVLITVLLYNSVIVATKHPSLNNDHVINCVVRDRN